MILSTLPDKVNKNLPLTERGKWINLNFIFGIDDEDYIISIINGKITQIKKRALATESGIFAIRAARSTWQEHWRAIPKRDYHDIWSMLPRQLITLDGNLLPLIQNLQFFKDLIASLREDRD